MDYIDLSDTDLLERLSGGDRLAFDTIYNRHWKELYKSACAVLKDQDACMDLCHDVFIWLWQHRDNHKITAIRPYLKTAVKYKIANYIRHGKIQESFFEKIKNIPEMDSAVHNEFELKELKLMIERFTKVLPERCKEIFELSRFEELSNKEIARKMGISEKTVENQITTALRRLRISLNRISIWLFFL